MPLASFTIPIHFAPTGAIPLPTQQCNIRNYLVHLELVAVRKLLLSSLLEFGRFRFPFESIVPELLHPVSVVIPVNARLGCNETIRTDHTNPTHHPRRSVGHPDANAGMCCA